jgi:hypothetical protein
VASISLASFGSRTLWLENYGSYWVSPYGSPPGRTAEPTVRQLLLLMDADKNGKVSKQEFMSFMDKEFDRLDQNHDGELDVKELKRLRVRPAGHPR